jgi:hypothetical protein
VRAVAGRMTEFTTDDVWSEMGDETIIEGRAMGAAMRRARADGVCVPTQTYRPSDRPACHGRPVRVWQVRWR